MIALTGLTNDQNPQLDLFNLVYNRGKEKEPLMQAFDAINHRYGRGTLKLACGLTGQRPADDEEKPWQLRWDYLSPCYTTNIKDIPVVR